MGNNSFSSQYKALLEEKAQLLKTLGQPIRLCILHQLITDGEKNVGEIISCMGVKQPNISQHLSKLRDLGYVEARKDGNQVYYSCNRQDVISIIKEVMGEN